MLRWLRKALSGPLARTPVIPPGQPVVDDVRASERVKIALARLFTHLSKERGEAT